MNGDNFEDLRKDYLFYFSRRLNKVMVEPDMIQIMLTSECNARCKICDVWKQRYPQELTTKQAKSLIKQAVRMGIKTIYFTGGEAFLRKDIFELINYAARPGVITTVNTNGSLITEALAKQIVLSKLRNITFSIDSILPEVHDYIRGAGCFEKAIQGIKLINKYKKEFNRRSCDAGDRRLDVGIASVIMKLNINELPKLVDLAVNLQCCYTAFQPLVFNGNLLESHNFKSEFWIDEPELPGLENMFNELEGLKKGLPKGFYVDFMREKTIQHFKRQRLANTCFAGFNRIFVNPKGDISFVCFESFGNIKNEPLKKAWNSKKAFEIRAKIKECKINCTQFCSERAQSEDIFQIHGRFSADECAVIRKKEKRFLKAVLQGVNMDKSGRDKDASRVAEELNELITGRNNLRLAELNKTMLENRIFKQFYIALTNRCNLRCIMCTTTTHPHELEQELPLEQWKRIIDNIIRFKVESIGFGGGEPFIRKDVLAELVKMAAAKGVVVNIITNATLLDKGFLEDVKKYKSKIIFLLSLDGLEQENDSIRGNGVFKKVMAAAYLLKSYDWQFFITSVLMPQNFLGYADFLCFLIKNFPDTRIDIQPIIPHNEVYHIRQKFQLGHEQLNALRGVLFYLNSVKEQIKLCRPLKIIDQYWDYFTNSIHSDNQCKMGTESFNINLRGNIWICGKELEYPLYKFGLEDVLSSNEYFLEMKRVQNCDSPCLAGLVI